MPSRSRKSSCFARTIPSTTGSTASRWLGFGDSVRLTFRAAGSLAFADGALVIFHVAFVGGKRRMHRTFKRSEDSFAKISDHIRQHIQTPAMGHAQRDVFDAARRRALDQLIQQAE